MRADPEAAKYFQFGRFTLDLVRGTLRDDAGDIPLRPKSFDVLRILVENEGCLIEKERLLGEVWNRSAVTSDSLTQCVVDIRKAIGDGSKEIIKTVPRRGYVFDAPVATFGNDPGSSLAAKPAGRIFLRSAYGVLALVVLAAGIGMYLSGETVHPPDSIDDSTPARSSTAEERRRTDNDQATHVAAHEAYRNGTVLLERRTGESLKGAIEFFRQATNLEPEFALAYVGLADALQLLVSHAESTAEEALPRALAAAQTAMDLDSGLGEAYASMGAIVNEAQKHRMHLGISEGPEYFFARAMALSPNYATAYQWYGEYLERTQDYEAAIEKYRAAAALEPSSPIVNHVLANALAALGRLGEAEKHWLRAIEVDPGFSRGHQGLAALYFSRTGQLAEAAVAARKAVLLNPSDSVNAALLANIYINLGDDARAARWIDEGKKGQPDHPVLQAIAALRFVMRGDEARAAELLEELNRAARMPQVAFHLLNDHYVGTAQFGAALNLCESRYPEVFASDPAVDFERLKYVAVGCAVVLRNLDRHDEAETILNRVRPLVGRQSLARDNRLYVLAAAIHAMDREEPLAISRLRQAIDSGWRYFVPYYLDHSPIFAGLRESSEFQALASDYRALLAAERRKLENHLLARAGTIDDVR